MRVCVRATENEIKDNRLRWIQPEKRNYCCKIIECNANERHWQKDGIFSTIFLFFYFCSFCSTICHCNKTTVFEFACIRNVFSPFSCVFLLPWTAKRKHCTDVFVCVSLVVARIKTVNRSNDRMKWVRAECNRNNWPKGKKMFIWTWGKAHDS